MIFLTPLAPTAGSLVPARLVEGHLVIQLDEHQRDGRVAQRPRQVADMTGGIRLRALVLAQGGVARSHLDPMPVHRLDEPAPRQRDDPLRCRIFMPLSDPSLRDLSDHDVSGPVLQLIGKDRLHALPERERAEVLEFALGLMGRPRAINPDVPVFKRLRARGLRRC